MSFMKFEKGEVGLVLVILIIVALVMAFTLTSRESMEKAVQSLPKEEKQATRTVLFKGHDYSEVDGFYGSLVHDPECAKCKSEGGAK